MALTDYVIQHEGQRHVVQRGSVVAVSQWIMHRDPRYWHKPERFDPERWAVPNLNRPKFAYFPFGAGPRQCIGEGFAWMEAILLLATLVRDWRAELLQEPPGLLPRITLRPNGGLKMRLHRW
jgi:cytochrome P450